MNVSPTINPNPASVGRGPAEMPRADAKAEEEAILLFKVIIKRPHRNAMKRRGFFLQKLFPLRKAAAMSDDAPEQQRMIRDAGS